MPVPFAKLLDAIPIVPTTAYRNAFYPSTTTINQRVHNLETGNIEKWNGTSWDIDFEGASSGGTPPVQHGTGSPQGVILGSPGWLYLQAVGTTGAMVWEKQTGTLTNTGWAATTGTGTGSPEGVFTATVGATFAQSDGVNGVALWVKRTGTGATGWVSIPTTLGLLNVMDYGAKGDGVTDDTTAIAAALAAGPGVVTAPPNLTFLVTAKLVMAADWTILDLAGSTLKASGAGPTTLLQVTGNFCTVRTTRFDVTDTAVNISVQWTGDDGTMDRCSVLGAATDVIQNGKVYVTGARTRLVGNVFDTLTYGVAVVGATGTLIADNTFLHYRTGVYLQENIAGGHSDTVIRGNRFLSIGGSGVTVGYDGILVGAPGANVTITQNQIVAAREHGIYISPDATAAGQDIIGGVIAENVIVNVGATNIKLRGATGNAYGWSITGNTISQASPGTHIGVLAFGVRDSAIVGNVCRGMSTGFSLEFCQNLHVRNNVIAQSNGQAIGMTDVTGAMIGLSLVGNRFENTNVGLGGFAAVQVTLNSGFASLDWRVASNVTADNQGSPTSRNLFAMAALAGGSTLDSVWFDSNTNYGNTVVLAVNIPATVTKVRYSGFGVRSETATTTTYTTTQFDEVVTGDATGGGYTINLVAANTVPNKVVTFKKIDATTGVITLDPASTQTIDGALTVALRTANQSITIQSDGANWKTLSAYAGFVGLASSSTTASSAAPAGTTSTTAVMMAVGGTLTPIHSTTALLAVSGQIANSIISDGATVQLRYGTGTAPVNGAAVSGTQVGASQTVTVRVAAQQSGFSIVAPVTGLTVGTAYWVDIALNAVTAGTVTATGVTVSAVEV